MYAYLVLEYTVDGKLYKILSEEVLKNITLIVSDRIRDENGIPQLGNSQLSRKILNKCDPPQFNQLKDNINTLVDGLIPNGKESNNLFTGKYLIDALQFTDVWQGCSNYLDTLIGVKSVVSNYFWNFLGIYSNFSTFYRFTFLQSSILFYLLFFLVIVKFL